MQLTTLPVTPSAAACDALPVSPVLDRVGIAASVACAIHCLAAPFLFLLLPAAGSIWSHPSVHWVLAALVLPLALLVVYRGYRRHRRRSAVLAMVLGAAGIVAGLVIPEISTSDTMAAAHGALANDGEAAHSDTAHSDAEPACTESCCAHIEHDAATGATTLSIPPASIVTLIGGLFLVTAHAINLHGCRCFTRSARDPATDCGCPA